MSGRLKRPLNKAAVKKAELKAKPLSATDPKQAALRQEWMDLYVKHGGKVENAKGKAKKCGETTTVCSSSKTCSLTKEQLKKAMPYASDANINKYLAQINKTLKKYQINTAQRVAHFLAQITHESGSLRYSEEIASGKAYEGRVDLGNTQPGDGIKFKGRGLIQLTGRANYKKYGDSIGIDLTQSPSKLEEPDLIVDVAGWYWDKHNLNELADKDDLVKITRKINGGLNGLDDRKKHLENAQKAKLCEKNHAADDSTEQPASNDSQDESSIPRKYYGKEAIKEVEKIEGPLSNKEKRIVILEGYVDGVYLDTKGIPTSGVGQTGKYMNMSAKDSIAKHEDKTRKLIPSYKKLPEYLQAELLQATYRGDLGDSPNFRKLFNEGKYEEAATEFLDHKEYKDANTKQQIKERIKAVSDAVLKYAATTSSG